MSLATQRKQSSRNRGFTQGSAQPRGGGAQRGRGGYKGEQDDGRAASARGRRGSRSRSRSGSPAGTSSRRSRRAMEQSGGHDYQARYTALEANRKRERADAIRRGLIADPDKPRALADAITLVGTCQDMCAEFERVERIVQKDVWKEETDPQSMASNPMDREPDEARMIKKFRRAAAGIEEQLPSDLRPPRILKMTCDYLFNEVVSTPEALGSVHHFVWDRTRAIRNDFSIQQITKPDDLSIAIDCYERIARFHIMSLHQLALPQKPYDKYDWQQEREQLDRTLLSLMQYYEDSRGRIPLPNEAEFRSYSVVFLLQDPVPDVEDRVQSWPREIALHPRIRQALQLYAAACTAHESQGPLKPGSRHVSAQQDWHRFWQIVESRGVPYLMACVAEIYFNHVRKTTLQALIEASGSKMTEQWTIEELRDMLAFDEDDEVEEFCERYTLGFKQVGERYLLNVAGCKGKSLPDAKPTASKQSRSQLVEQKRYSRTLPAIIVGLTIQQARQQGMIDDEGDIGMHDSGDDMQSDQDTLFVSETTKAKPLDAAASIYKPAAPSQQSNSNPFAAFKPTGGFNSPFAGTEVSGENKSGFSKPSPFAPSAGATTTGGSEFSFGKPSSGPTNGSSGFNFLQAGGPKVAETKPASTMTGSTGFNFMKAAPPATEETETTTTVSSSTGFSFLKPAAAAAETSDELSQAAPKNSTGFSFLKSSASTDRKPDAAAAPSMPSKSPFSFGQPSSASADVSKPSAAPSTGFASSKTSAQDTKKDEKSSSSHTQGLFSSAPFAPQAKELPTFNFMSAKGASAAKEKSVPAAASAQTSAVPSVLHGATNTPKSDLTFAQPKVTLHAEVSAETAPGNQKTDSASPTKTKGHFFEKAQQFDPNNPFEKPPAIPREHVLGPPQYRRPNSPHQKPSSTPGVALGAWPPAPSARNPSPAPAPTVSLDTVIHQLAQDITLNDESGFLRQYIDFVVSQIVTEAQDKVYHEKIEEEAKDFRAYKLSVKYALLWRATCKRRRLARHGRGQRQRAKERLNELRSQGSQASSVTGSQRAGSRQREVSRQEQVDAMFQQSVRAGRWKASPAAAGTGASKDTGNAESKTVSRTDANGRIVKPTPSSESLRRSLNGSGLASPLRSTTRSSYFRRKALGIDVTGDSTSYGSRKRAHSEVSTDSRTSQQFSSPVSSAAASPARQQSSVEPQAVSKFQKQDFNDDALFARLRAAREGLETSTAYLKRETTRTDSPPSMGPPALPYQSPGLDQARMEARRRASLEAASGDVPAYRLRESRFVPRELYGRAIENARSIREGRSRANSRPASQASGRPDDLFMTNGKADQSSSPHPPPAHASNDFTQTLSGQHIDVLDNDLVLSNHTSFSKTVVPLQKAATQPDNPVDDSNAADHSHDHEVTEQDPFGASHDFTIAQSHIPDALNASFHSSNAGLGNDHFAAIARSAAQHAGSSFTIADQEEDVEDEEQQTEQDEDEQRMSHGGKTLPKHRYNNNNPFASLQELADEDEEAEADEEDDDEGFEEGAEDEEDGEQYATNEYGSAAEQYAEGEYSEEEADGDIDEDEDEEDEEEEDDDGDDDDEQPSANAYYNRVQAAADPPVNEALAAIGNNETDAIELSD